MERSKSDGPVEKCHAKIGVGVPGGNTGGARERPAPERDPVKLVGIDVPKHIANAMVRKLAKATACQLIEDTARSLMRIMGLPAEDCGFCLRAVAALIDPEDDDTEAPPG